MGLFRQSKPLWPFFAKQNGSSSLSLVVRGSPVSLPQAWLGNMKVVGPCRWTMTYRSVPLHDNPIAGKPLSPSIFPPIVSSPLATLLAQARVPGQKLLFRQWLLAWNPRIFWQVDTLLSASHQWIGLLSNGHNEMNSCACTGASRQRLPRVCHSFCCCRGLCCCNPWNSPTTKIRSAGFVLKVGVLEHKPLVGLVITRLFNPKSVLSFCPFDRLL